MKRTTQETLLLAKKFGVTYPLDIWVLSKPVKEITENNESFSDYIVRSEEITSESHLIDWLERHEDQHIALNPHRAAEFGKKSAEIRKKKGHDSKYYSELAKRRWKKNEGETA